MTGPLDLIQESFKLLHLGWFKGNVDIETFLGAIGEEQNKLDHGIDDGASIDRLPEAEVDKEEGELPPRGQEDAARKIRDAATVDSTEINGRPNVLICECVGCLLDLLHSIAQAAFLQCLRWHARKS